MEPQPAGSWWQRNWKWFVPAGCLTLLLLFGGSIAAIFYGVSSAMRSSDAVRVPLGRAQADCELRELLGAPIRPGWLISGSLNVTGPSGAADLSIPLHGPRGDATLFVVAAKEAGEWRFERMEVDLPERPDRVDLADLSRPRCAEESAR
jgi:hypothetical protein